MKRWQQKGFRIPGTAAALATALAIAVCVGGGFSAYQLLRGGDVSSAKVEKERLDRVQRLLRKRVCSAYAILEKTYRSTASPAALERRYGPWLRRLLDIPCAVLEREYQEALARQDKTDASPSPLFEAQQHARTAIAALRDPEHACFWIWKAAPSGTVQGERKTGRRKSGNLSGSGSPPPPELLGKVNSAPSGEAFLLYSPPDAPATPFPHRRLCYARLFKPWGWILGTSVSTRQAELEGMAWAAQQIAALGTSEPGALWIMDNRLHLVLPPPSNTKNSSLRFPESRPRPEEIPREEISFRGKLLQVAARAPEEEHFLSEPEYGSRNPRIVCIRFFKPWRWVVGAGFSLQTIREAAARHSERIRRAARNQAVQWGVGSGALVLLAFFLARLWMKRKIERPLQETLKRAAALAGEIETSCRLLKEYVHYMRERTNAFRETFETTRETAKAVSERAHALAEEIRGHHGRLEEGISLCNSLIQRAKEAEAGLEENRQELSHIADSMEELLSPANAEGNGPQDARAGMERTAKRLAAAWKTVHTASKRTAPLSDTSALLHACATEMGEVAETVAALARDTRLLALNAAIQAAHWSEAEAPLKETAERSRQLAGRMDQEAGELRKKTVRTRYHAIQSAKAIETIVQAVAEIDSILADSMSALREGIPWFRKSWETIHRTAENARAVRRRIRDTESAVRDTGGELRQTAHMGIETADTLRRISESWQTLAKETERLAAAAPHSSGTDGGIDSFVALLRETDRISDALAAAVDTLKKTLDRFTP